MEDLQNQKTFMTIMKGRSQSEVDYLHSPVALRRVFSGR